MMMDISVNCTKVTETLYRELLCPLEKTANKGKNGTLGIIAGSECYRGAACLAVGGAMKTGVGIVRLISVEKAVECTAARYPSCTFLPVKADAEGLLEHSDFVRRLPVITEKSSAILCGCGLGQSSGNMRILRDVISLDMPLLLDADALNLLSRDTLLLKRRNAPTVITPHIGEMSRLCQQSIAEIKSDRQNTALNFAREHGVTVVLKDDVMFIASPDGTLYGSALGNEGLAKGGSGDVLAGLIAGYLAQGYSASEASVLGCAEHGLAAKRAAEAIGVRAMRPEHLL